MLGFGSLSKRIFGTPNERKIKATQSLVDQINALEPEFQALSDEQIKEKTVEFKDRIAKGEKLDAILPEAFANAREGAFRALGLRAYDVQLMGGIFLHQGNISEMKTGEGKTLVATLPAYLNALTGRSVHVVTVNDYLATRDSEWMGRVYDFLGLTTGVVIPNMDEGVKAEAYKCDIIYATNNELAFDYLRDNMKSELEQMNQRDHHFAIVDEVDSILIDEARTPLIISGPAEDRTELYVEINKLIPEVQEEHYTLDEKSKSAVLTDEGNDFIERRFHELRLMPPEQSLYDPESTTLVHHVNQALLANVMFKRDKDYIVRDDQVVLIDEFTGRMMTGRRLSQGLHQAIEAKEGVKIQPENVTHASVTFQNYFRLYEKLGGMTGTAQTEAEEFLEIYGLGVVEVPTNRPIKRMDDHDAIYRTADEKYKAIVAEIAKAHHKGQPTLVGTTSIEKSEYLSALMKDKNGLAEIAKKLAEFAESQKKDSDKQTFLSDSEAVAACAALPNGIPHQVLNARFHEQEAQIVGDAGIPGAVTIATNMAGRGTDIQLGGNVDMRVNAAVEAEGEDADLAAIRAKIETEVAEAKQQALDAGGLFVLATERHESRRIDNQLRGRSGRQGDPGRSAFFLSLEDDLMRIFGSDKLEAVLSRLGMQEGEAIVHPWVNKSLERAQAKVEGHNFDIRKQLLKFDDVMNDQRKAIFGQRLDVMKAQDLSSIIKDMRDEVIDDLVDDHIPAKSYADQWDTKGLKAVALEKLAIDADVPEWADEDGIDEEEIAERLSKAADKMMATKAADFGAETMRGIEKQLLLQTMDTKWREHLITLEHLRSVVGMRGYAQRDPLNEYKTEGFGLFENMLESLRGEITTKLAHIRPMTEEEQQQMIQQQMAMMAAAQGEGSADAPAAPNAAAAAPADAGEDFDPENPDTWPPTGRNDQCRCGSGKKFKHCHGRI